MMVALGRDRRCQISEVLQEFLQDLLQRDCYLQQQITAIAECTDDLRLRNALLFTAIEEYCLRPVRNQPLIVYRFINYMRRYAPGGVTQVPNNSEIRIVLLKFLLKIAIASFNLLGCSDRAIQGTRRKPQRNRASGMKLNSSYLNI
ncbi:MAG: hypothetical protein CLLPBCKN_000835 [Chroococcidiopsis cubana SAG 39.79]|uniref:hypothetical protein n=1 Tax=Chroococcidiopsis cubana TaxID=171392 RepID=UPI002AC49DE4|nr:hypothetical protein [Chroococcidiopsis cubana]MDZ4871447.1 hypothetical protein [Chroococcidiopsis cubana SAG 39.79]